MSLNKCMIIGNLGRDPEMRYTPSGQAVTQFTVAVNRNYKDSQGERQEETEWFRVVAWGQQAEFAAEYLRKGAKVFIEGRIQTRQWEGQDGQKRYTTGSSPTRSRTSSVARATTPVTAAALPPEPRGQRAPAAKPAGERAPARLRRPALLGLPISGRSRKEPDRCARPQPNSPEAWRRVPRPAPPQVCAFAQIRP
jgi:single-strand DNA-binding protein